MVQSLAKVESHIGGGVVDAASTAPSASYVVPSTVSIGTKVVLVAGSSEDSSEMESRKSLTAFPTPHPIHVVKWERPSIHKGNQNSSVRVECNDWTLCFYPAPFPIR